MAACLKLRAVFQKVSYGCGCQHVRLTYIQPLSFLATQQVQRKENKLLTDGSKFTCLVWPPHNRQEMTFTKKRRKFVPRHQEDQVSTDMTLVYENNMNRMNFWGQLIINVLAVPVYGLSINLIASNWPLQVKELSITSGPLTAVAYMVVYGVLLMGVNGIGWRSVHRIYTDSDAVNFAAVVQDWKMTERTIHFDLASAHRKSPGKVAGAFFGNLKIQGRSFLVTPTDFIQPRFYNLLMGYELQRPVEKDIIKDIDLRDYMHNPAKKSKKPPKAGR